MGSYRRDRHTASRNSAGSTTERAPAAALRRLEALPDPAPRCGENSRPGKVHHRLEDSREAILWFYGIPCVKRFSPLFWEKCCKQTKSSCKMSCTRLGRF